MAATIPEDVVFQILVWLPVVSLLRFKSVCKSWRSLIDSSRFISQHTHHRCLSDSADHKLIVLNSDIDDFFYFSISFISVNPLQLFKYVEFSPTDELHDSYESFDAHLIASFNGLICLLYKSDFEDTDRLSSDVVSLWNPATKQFTILPPGQSDIKETRYGRKVVIEYGFGFDVQTNDYKVVRVSLKYDAHDEFFRSQVEVYSLRMGCWRFIDAVLPPNFIITHNPRQPFRNEIYCWSGYDQNLGCSLILSFDFSKEVFGIIPVPDGCSLPSLWKVTLSFLRGKIAIACVNQVYNEPCEIWILDKYGVQGSWTNPYTIMLDQTDEPMGFSMDGNIILIKGDEERKLYLCDPLTQIVNEVPTQGLISEVAVYKESLISFKNATGVTKKVVYEDMSKKISDHLDLGLCRTRIFIKKTQDLLRLRAMLSQEDDLVP